MNLSIGNTSATSIGMYATGQGTAYTGAAGKCRCYCCRRVYRRDGDNHRAGGRQLRRFCRLNHDRVRSVNVAAANPMMSLAPLVFRLRPQIPRRTLFAAGGGEGYKFTLQASSGAR